MNRWNAVSLVLSLAITNCGVASTLAQTNQSELIRGMRELNAALEQYLIQLKSNDFAGATQSALAMRRISETSLRSQPVRLVESVKHQAHVLYMQDEYEKSIPLFEWCLKRAQTLPDMKPSTLATYSTAVANAYHYAGRQEQALKMYQQSVVYDSSDSRAWIKIGKIQKDRNNPGKAEEAYQRVLAIREGKLGREHQDVADVLSDLGLLYKDQGRHAEAEPVLKRALAIREKVFGPSDKEVAYSLDRLAWLYDKQRRYAESEPLYLRALAIYERQYGRDDSRVILRVTILANSYNAQGRYHDAQLLFERVLAAREKTLGPQHLEVAGTLNRLALTHENQGQYAKAELLCRRALEIREKMLEPDHLDVSDSLNRLAWLQNLQYRYSDAEALYDRALAIRESALGPDHHLVGSTLNGRSSVYQELGRYGEAESSLKRALTISEMAGGSDTATVGTRLNNLAMLYLELDRYAEAETLAVRALEIAKKTHAPNHPDTALYMANLACIYNGQGRYAESEPLFQQALAIRAGSLGEEHPAVADSLCHLAFACNGQGRYAAAEPLFRRALGIREKHFGSEHPSVASSNVGLGIACTELGKTDEAERLLQEALAIREAFFGKDNLTTAGSLHSLAWFYGRQKRFAEAEPLLNRELAIRERISGSSDSGVANALRQLASIKFELGHVAEAEDLVDRALLIYERGASNPNSRYKGHLLRATIAYKQKRPTEAIYDLKRAMEIAEQQRAMSSGTELERAETFSGFDAAFELMVRWQSELGNVDEALNAIERGRARSLLDELRLSGADLEVGRTALEREQLARREADLRTQVASLEQQLTLLANEATSPDATQARNRLNGELSIARGQLYEFHRDQRGTNPIYRNLLSAGAGPPRLSQIQRHLVSNGGLLLVYLIGEDNGYVVAVDQNEATLHELAVAPSDAERLGVDAGPLTSARLRTALLDSPTGGALVQLKQQQGSADLTHKLSAMWRILIPEACRPSLVSGTIKHLMIVPDGQLALLPFEALITDSRGDIQYLLDVGPPIQYAPSATVLYNLQQRPANLDSLGVEPVLTVGQPDYGQVASATELDEAEILAPPIVRYGTILSRFTPLPHTGQETEWVRQAFQDAGSSTIRLVGQDATEANVRTGVAGRRVVHLACHGFADQSYGNFFGALAVTPGGTPRTDAANDGLLTLAEVYDLNLKSCELAVLSACETNYGPNQSGEGVWALSRGFIVAGARRVVASNWVVDDRAAANLIGNFAGSIAKAETTDEGADYASALHNAKRWIRQQDGWSSPYYWASFVLVGPK